MYTRCLSSRQGLSHSKGGVLPARPVRNETGQPWRLPLSVDSGVLISYIEIKVSQYKFVKNRW